MARIRSVHPSLWTDDDFMELSIAARLFLIGLWGEAFDDGVFAWKPKGLKARIFPGDNVDVEPLLAELIEGGFVRAFENGGKSYGLVRNFRRFQRPKKPNESGVLPSEYRTYVGLTASSTEPVRNQKQNEPGEFSTSSEPVPNQFRTSSEKPIQMEDGGCRREEKEEPKGSSKKKSSSNENGHRLPNDWEPSDKLKTWAMTEEGLSEFEVRRETEKFRDHWHDKTGKDATKKSWDGTFRNWIRKGRDWRKPKGDGDKTAAELSPMPKYESQPGEDYSHLLAPMPGEPGYDEWREKQGLPPYEPLPFERHDLP